MKKEDLSKKALDYNRLVQKQVPKPPLFLNCCKAFFAGGFICALAQVIQFGFIYFFDFTETTAGNPTMAVMIILAVILTCMGVYDKIAQWAGAGSAVPITGFANGMASAALEYRSEGFVLGVGGNMFKVAGPVIVFGVVAAFVVAIIRYLILAFMV